MLLAAEENGRKDVSEVLRSDLWHQLKIFNLDSYRKDFPYVQPPKEQDLLWPCSLLVRTALLYLRCVVSFVQIKEGGSYQK